jgi:hypothetical protein
MVLGASAKAELNLVRRLEKPSAAAVAVKMAQEGKSGHVGHLRVEVGRKSLTFFSFWPSSKTVKLAKMPLPAPLATFRAAPVRVEDSQTVKRLVANVDRAYISRRRGDCSSDCSMAEDVSRSECLSRSSQRWSL